VSNLLTKKEVKSR